MQPVRGKERYGGRNSNIDPARISTRGSGVAGGFGRTKPADGGGSVQAGYSWESRPTHSGEFGDCSAILLSHSSLLPLSPSPPSIRYTRSPRAAPLRHHPSSIHLHIPVRSPVHAVPFLIMHHLRPLPPPPLPIQRAVALHRLLRLPLPLVAFPLRVGGHGALAVALGAAGRLRVQAGLDLGGDVVVLDEGGAGGGGGGAEALGWGLVDVGPVAGAFGRGAEEFALRDAVSRCGGLWCWGDVGFAVRVGLAAAVLEMNVR